MKAIQIALFLGMGYLAACSSDQEQGEELENNVSDNAAEPEDGNAAGDDGNVENAPGADNANNADSANAESEDDSGDEAAVDEGGDDMAPTDDAPVIAEDPTNAPPAEAMPEAGAEAVPTANAAAAPDAAAPADANMAAGATAGAAAPAAGAAPAAAPASGLWDPTRVVRFINADGTPVYTSMSTGGETLGMLRKGDHVMVILQGDWAMVSDTAYIQASALSVAAEPRTKRNGDWIPPAE